MKKFWILLTVLFAVLACSEEQSNIQQEKMYQEQMDALNTSIEVLDKVQSEIRTMISVLEADEVKSRSGNDEDALKPLANSLKQIDANLKEKIDDLKALANDRNRGMDVWVEATVDALELYNSIVNYLSELSELFSSELSSVNETIQNNYLSLSSKITEAQTSIQAWVAIALENYATNEDLQELAATLKKDLEAFDARLSDLEERIKELEELMTRGDSLLGMWAQIDDNQLSNTYINFEGKIYSKYSTDYKSFIHKKTAWGTSVNNYKMAEKMAYTISGNALYLDGERFGEYNLQKDTLTVNNVKFLKMNKFSTVPYSALTLKSERPAYDYKAGVKTIEYELVNPVPGARISAAAYCNWVTDFSYEEGAVSFNIADNDTGRDRQGGVGLVYMIDDVYISNTLSINFIQTFTAAEIATTPGTTSCDYTGGDFSFTYEIMNPREGVEVVASSECDWITDVTHEGNAVSFKVAENNSGSSRTGKVKLEYGSFVHKYVVTQTYNVPDITVTPLGSDCNYSGGVLTFSYYIANSRSDGQLDIAADRDWISNINISNINKSNGTVSFSVAATDKVCRIAVLSLSYGNSNWSYGSYGNPSATYTVIQKGNFNLATDLSVTGTANCYIVSEKGNYKYKAVKGNSTESVGAVASAEVLWESFGTSTAPSVGDLIEGAVYSDGYIYFSTPDTFREGNAVIAAKDASGTILWSWHIWLTDKPEDQIYNNNAGTMMDRNLGATSATPGDVGALGLLYQWGRKDPFLGSSSISRSTQAASTITWPSAVSSNSSKGTISYAKEHPTTFIAGSDWYYTGSSSTDDTRWQSSKTIYDPCPPGYRVPDGGDNDVWATALGTSGSAPSYDFTNKGFNLGYSDTAGNLTSETTCWYPDAGYLEWDDGSLCNVGSCGSCWSCSCGYFLFFNDASFFPSDIYIRARGYSVRCLRE